MIRGSVITVCLCGAALAAGVDRRVSLPEGEQLSARAQESDRSTGPASQRPIQPRQQTLRGKVRWLNTVLSEQTRVKPDKDAPNPTVLQTDDGRVFPILKDDRGRAFYQDKRLRDRPMELSARTWQGIPHVQVLSVYSIKNGRRHVVDYWCDTCAISTYDLRPCLCCQDLFGPMRLREEPVR